METIEILRGSRTILAKITSKPQIEFVTWRISPTGNRVHGNYFVSYGDYTPAQALEDAVKDYRKREEEL